MQSYQLRKPKANACREWKIFGLAMAFGITVEYKLNVIQQHDMASEETIVVLGLHQQDYTFQIMASNTSSLVCVGQIPA